MLLACAVAVLAVVLGLGLGLAPVARTRVAGPLRTFALSAALTVVLLHLLPEALSALGPLALALFAATSVVPAWLRLARGVFAAEHDERGAHGGLVAGYLGLLAHHVGDGLGLGAYASLPGGAEGHADVMLALAAHTIPLVAVVAFAFQRSGGRRAATRAAAGLAAASVFGVVLSSTVPDGIVGSVGAWIAALVAGLLVHVVTHDLARDLPVNASGRALDALAAALGVATSLLGGEESAGHHPAAFVEIAGYVLGRLALPVVAGLLLAFWLAPWRKLPFRAALGAAFGASLALDGVVVALWTGGSAFGIFYAAGVVLVAGVVQATLKNALEPPPAPAESSPWLVRLDDDVTRALPWIFAAFVLVAVLAASFPQRGLSVLSPPAALAVALLVALPIRLPPLAATLAALALERAGLCFEAALVVAQLASAPGASELTMLTRRHGAGAAVRAAAAISGAALALGIAARWLADLLAPYLGSPFPELSSRLAFLVLLVLTLRAAFERGLRGLLLPIFPSHDTAAHSDVAFADEPVSPSKRSLPNAT